MKTLSKYSIGTGDRFAHQAKAQLQACIQALDHGMEIVPVWNKSNREHTIIGSEPASVRAAADAAVKALGWKLPTSATPTISPAQLSAASSILLTSSRSMWLTLSASPRPRWRSTALSIVIPS